MLHLDELVVDHDEVDDDHDQHDEQDDPRYLHHVPLIYRDVMSGEFYTTGYSAICAAYRRISLLNTAAARDR